MFTKLTRNRASQLWSRRSAPDRARLRVIASHRADDNFAGNGGAMARRLAPRRTLLCRWKPATQGRQGLECFWNIELTQGVVGEEPGSGRRFAILPGSRHWRRLPRMLAALG
jgi:hypothetical protein